MSDCIYACVDKDHESREWHVVRVKSHFEWHVSLSIRCKGLEEFLPAYAPNETKQQTKLYKPLFPGYVFCRVALRDKLDVLKIPGVVNFLGVGNVPLAVKDEEICAVRRVVHGGLPIQIWPFMRAGHRIRVEKGPLSGLEGTVLCVKSTWRIVVSVTLLQRSVAVEVDPSWLTAI